MTNKTAMAHTGKDIDLKQTPVVLAIETATMFGSIAVTAGNLCIGEHSLQSQLTHSRRLLEGLQRLLDDCQVGWEQIDAVAVSLGPGSFTGLRIGLSTAKGLALAAEKPLVGVATLDGLAGQFFSQPFPVYPVLDARRDEIYTAGYRCDEQGVSRRVGDYMVISPAEFCRLISEPSIFIGDGVSRYGEFFRQELGDLMIVGPAGLFYPRASVIGWLGAEKWHQQDFLDTAAAVPIYLRPSEAEMHFGK